MSAHREHDRAWRGWPRVGTAAPGGRRGVSPLVRFGGEAAVAVLAVVAYFLVRGFTEGARADALANAHDVIRFERWLGIYVETEMQDLFLPAHWAETLVNWVYIWGHWPTIAVVAGWLYWRHRDTYHRTLYAFLLSGAVGLVIFATFPVAPPRLASAEFVDTVTMYSHAYRVLQPPNFVNQYAAMPSLHFGWDLLIGIAVVRAAPNLAVRLFGIILPVAMAFAVVLTANHYILDTVAGAALALLGLWASANLHRVHDFFSPASGGAATGRADTP